MVLAKVIEKICVCVHARVRECGLYLQSVCLVLPTHGENCAVASLQILPSRLLGSERERERKKRTANVEDEMEMKAVEDSMFFVEDTHPPTMVSHIHREQETREE